MHGDTPKMLTCATAVVLKTLGSRDSSGTADTEEDITIAGDTVQSLSEWPGPHPCSALGSLPQPIRCPRLTEGVSR